ncbi:hypothetical protein EVAR_81579_1 [Eumeta japonica]|uniref:Uncharacterized protein n=1 Tax=Eumeta variegata TaxID=151549 RepID=A0A4C1UZ86_EUMVA|nr:hypothetical protein EVAR_81579_1 [Eumeta japonica]
MYHSASRPDRTGAATDAVTVSGEVKYTRLLLDHHSPITIHSYLNITSRDEHCLCMRGLTTSRITDRVGVTFKATSVTGKFSESRVVRTCNTKMESPRSDVVLTNRKEGMRQATGFLDDKCLEGRESSWLDQ